MHALAAVLIVLTVIGYVFLRHGCYRTAVRWDALEWQQNVFESTGVGLLLFAVARLILPLVDRFPPAVSDVVWNLLNYVRRHVPFPYPEAVFAALVIGLLGAMACNGLWSKDTSLRLAIQHHGGSLRRLLHEAHRRNKAVMVSLESRKVYVGLVFSPPGLRSPSHVVLFPTISGHRTSDSLEIKWTTDYSPAYLEMMERKERGEVLATEPGDFQLVIPVEGIGSATYFDLDIYDRHFAGGAKPGASDVEAT